MYSVLSYGRMAADGVRIDAYGRAIATTVKPGDVVVDLGCGTGILSLLALRAGACRVHAIDTNPAVWLARDLARENGVADKLVIHHKSSLDVELGEQADVIVADLRGSSPFLEQNIAAVEDARRRWLSPQGVLVPDRDRVFVALVEAEAHRRELERSWAGVELQGFRGAAARSAVLNCAYSDARTPVAASHVLSEAKCWTEVVYGEPPARSHTGTVELAVRRAGTAHALAVWFEATLHGDIGFTTAPGQELVYRRILLPLPEPVRVAFGDAVRVTLRVDATGGEWAWDTEIGGACVRQATFLGIPTSSESLLRESLTATPARSPSGDRANQILAMMDGSRTLRELADAVETSDPGLRRESLLDEVRACVRRYAR